MSREERRRGYLNEDDHQLQNQRDHEFKRRQKIEQEWNTQRQRVLELFTQIKDGQVTLTEELSTELLSAAVKLADVSYEDLRIQGRALVKEIAAYIKSK